MTVIIRGIAISILACMSFNTSYAVELLSGTSNFEYLGAFRITKGSAGNPRPAYTSGPFILAEDGQSFFIGSHKDFDNVAEYDIPALSTSLIIGDLSFTGSPLQNWVDILVTSYMPTGNTQGIDYITGGDVISGQLIINASWYYTEPTTKTHTTISIDDSSALGTSAVQGFFNLQGYRHSVGWISEIPTEYQVSLGGDYITGFCDLLAIDGYNSIGPTAWVTDSTDILDASSNTPIAQTGVMDFSDTNPMDDSRYDHSAANDMWLITAEAAYGFIVPGTYTYVVVGYMEGMDSGIGYKITQDTGYVCGGPCSYVSADSSNYVWFFDVRDFIDVKNGTKNAYDVRPYYWGEWETTDWMIPNNTAERRNRIIGADYDSINNILYVMLYGADEHQDVYEDNPMVLAYQINLPQSSPHFRIGLSRINAVTNE